MPGPGSKKQSQRTKGNTKPSSSSEAAKLLAEAGTAPTGFIGFGTQSATPAYVPASEVLDDVDSNLDPDFRMVLRKVMKRDSTTKIKALQEVTVLFGDKDEDLVKAVLPFWPRNYNKLAIDVDYRVREATQQAHNALVLRMRKSLAPFLKTLMGSWLLSQCDTYPTVASAAVSAFQTAFPSAKQSSAIAFCKSEVCEYLMDNLLKQTPSTLSDPKSTEKEDMENKYNRVMTSSLLAFRKFLTALSTEQITELTEQINQLLSDPKLWKHGKSSVTSIKAGMYSFLAGICQSCPEVAVQHSKKISPYILHNLDEKDPVICPAVWEAALSLVNFVEDCWKDINVEKAFWPKLRSFIGAGCHGNASYVAGDLLPFMSKVPCDILGDKGHFHEECLSYFKQGLAKEQVQSSIIELSALTKAFMECSQYIIKFYSKTSESTSIAKDILLKQTYPVLQSSLTDEKSSLCKTSLYTLIGKLSANLETSESLIGAVTEFWNVLGDGVDVAVNDLKTESSRYFVDRLVHFVKCLMYPGTTVKTKSDSRVKFAVPGQKQESIVQYSGEKEKLTVGAERFVERVTLKSFTIAYHEKNRTFLHLFASLIELQPSEDTLQKVITSCKEEKQGDQSNSSFFVFEICLPWLDQSQSSEGEDLDPEELISVLYTFLPLLEQEAVMMLLIKLTEMLRRFQHFHCLFERVLSTDKVVPGVNAWLGSEALGQRLTDIVTVVCQGCMQDSELAEEEIQCGWDIITLVLSTEGKSVPQQIVEKILTTVLESLKQIHSSDKTNKIDVAVRFVSVATQSFFVHSEECIVLPSATELLLTLYTISMENLYITEETSSLAETTWGYGIGKIVKETGGLLHEGSVLNRTAGIIKGKLKKVQSLSGYDGLCHNVQKLLDVVRDSLPSSEEGQNPTVSAFIQQLYVSDKVPINAQVLGYVMLRRDVSFLDLPRTVGQSDISMVSALYTALHNASLLSTSSSELSQSSSQTIEEEESASTLSQDFRLSESERNVLLHVVQSWSILQLWSDAEKKVASFSDIVTAMTKLDSLVKGILQAVCAEDQQCLVTTALDRCLSSDYTWPLSLPQLLRNFSQNTPFTLNYETLMERCVEFTEGSVQMLQACTAHLDIASCTSISELMVARLLSCPTDLLYTPDGGLGALSVLNVVLRRTAKESLPDLLKGILSQILTWRDEDADLLLLDCQVNDAKPSHILLNVELATFLERVVSEISKELGDREWDFILCTCVSWIQSIDASSADILSSLLVEDFVCSVSGLFTAIADCIQNKLPQAITQYPPNLRTEWQEFFSEAAYSVVMVVFNKLVDAIEKADHPNIAKSATGSSVNITTMMGCHHLVFQALGSSLSLCPKQHLLDHKLPALLRAGESSPLPDTLQSLLNHICSYLPFTDSAVQITGFNLLRSIIEELPQHYKEEKEGDDSKAEEQTIRSPPQGLMDIMKASSLMVRDMVHELTPEETLTIEQHTEEYRWTLSHLLVWETLLVLFKHAPDELRQEYAGYLREEQCLETVMHHLLRLMPSNPSSDPFELLEGVNPKDETLSIQRLACAVYYHTLEIMPAMARQWWKDQDRKTAAYIDRFTSKYVSPLLCTEEINSVNVDDTSLQNITIRTRPATREVIATYALEEVSIEIVICLPQNYPLGNISVSSEKKVGVSAAQWDKWLLQLNIFLQHQNGSIIDGLRIWKRNIDKRFEGVEDCMICFSVLHSTNFQLPRMVCKTCKKKFHSACLYKWFQTSHNSTCPLCRNLF